MRAKWIVPVALSSLFLLLFFWFKVIRFQGLYYTFNDMYIFLQASYSWINDRPLLYENIGGYDDRIHNNYAMLLWGPLIYLSGAYGAFVVQTALSLLSYGLTLRHISRQMQPWAIWMILLVLLTGPVWFWLNDHPGIGWHPELTYLPLSLLFILALLTYQTIWFWITAGLIVLVKEDGALLAGAIHLAFLSIQYLVANRQRSIFGVLAQPRFWKVLGSWAAVFILGMAFLSYKNHSAEPEPRLQQALSAIRDGLQDRAFIRKNLILLFQTFLLLLPSIGMLLYGLYRVGWRQAGSVLLIYMVAQLALLLSNWVQGATYYGTNALFDMVSLTWPPRFVLVYTFSITYILTIWSLFAVGEKPVTIWKPILLGGLLLVIQLPIVQYARPDFRLVSILKDVVRHRFDPFKEPLLPATDVAVIEKLSTTIPAHSNVFVFDFLIPFFHKHYNIWPTDKQWENADLAIIPNNDFQKLGERLPRVMKRPYRPIRLTTYTIFVTPAYEPYVTAALPNKPESK
ncbi:glycosyltransferase family protein [Spirosoma validum]|uniref:Uncharacterized protein n=1 Tax=Spirosoma validum TaxID=2771355 RepID=A0A927AZT3_9BACT|nr:hypothetical protein [Spirosoma validum]MBD2752900.1 hypothetical protein [Spirosoma validum]